MLQIKKLVDIEEIRATQLIEEQVWNLPVTPIHQTYTASKNGGMILGAYDNDELVGYQYSFPGFKNGQAYLCSHMLGVLPAYQKGGLGEKLKAAQKECALKMGYSLIVWTYDPLESVNAYLNLHKLKGIAASYLEDHYGVMEDPLNKGIPTDRFLVEWWICSDHIQSEQKNDEKQSYEPLIETELDKSQFPIIRTETELIKDKDVVLIPIPENFQQMKQQQPNLALEWRYKTRKWFQELCFNNYVAVDVRRNSKEKVSYYVFRKRNSLALVENEEGKP
ncbi:GNAT family N-acetyltransferase [Viridibacillus arvi]|uniref:GNAT family N-acetyltransferase n=1 Tax=Viridibacillus arvi TaxID=263475 RepID=UPI0034CE3B2C